jgi:hypothetical protein
MAPSILAPGYMYGPYGQVLEPCANNQPRCRVIWLNPRNPGLLQRSYPPNVDRCYYFTLVVITWCPRPLLVVTQYKMNRGLGLSPSPLPPILKQCTLNKIKQACINKKHVWRNGIGAFVKVLSLEERFQVRFWWRP